MQTVSSTFTANATAPNQFPTYGILISWLETINSSYEFFTIGTSLIGGPDVIKGGGNEATFLDRYQYTDYSDYGISFSVNRAIGQYPYGTIMAQAEVKLVNTDLTFMPGHDPTIGNYILPNRPVKLTEGLASDQYGTGREDIAIFAGYSMAPVNDVNTRETVLTCYDGMNYLNMTVSTGSGPIASTNNGVYVNEYAHVIIQDLLQEAGFSTTDFVIEQSLQQPIGYLSPINFQGGTNVQGNQGSIGYIIAALCEAEMGIAFFDEMGTFHFWNRQHIPDDTTVQWKFDYSETIGGGNNTGIINYSIENTPVINSVEVQSSPRAVASKQQIWQLSSPVLIPANSTGIVSADFTDDSGSMPVTELDTPALFNATNAATSNFAVNLNSDGSATTDVSSYMSVSTVSLKGSNAQITFSNTYSQPIYITQMALYGTPAKVTQIIDQVFTNASSIALYGINPSNNGQPLQIQNDLIQDPDTAYSIAYQLVTDYNAPLQRLTMDVMAAPHLQFGDYVQVTIDDTNQTLNYTIVGKTDSFDKDNPLAQTLECEVKQMVTYFTIGTSLIGSTDQIAP